MEAWEKKNNESTIVRIVIIWYQSGKPLKEKQDERFTLRAFEVYPSSYIWL